MEEGEGRREEGEGRREKGEEKREKVERIREKEEERLACCSRAVAEVMGFAHFML